MKIVITGAAGFVGKSLIPMLLMEGNDIVAIDRNRKSLGLVSGDKIDKILTIRSPRWKASFMVADVSIPGKWEESFQDADVVITLHAEITSTSYDKYARSNIIGTRNVIAACRDYRIKKLIHMSSSVVIPFENRNVNVFRDYKFDKTAKKEDSYAFTKRMGEDYVRMSGIPYTILRPSLLYGKGDNKHLSFITRLMRISPIVPIPGSGKYVRQPVYVGDLCNIIVKLIKRKPKNEIWSVIGKEKVYFIQLLKFICATKGWRRLFLLIPLPIFSFMLRIFGGFTPAQMKALAEGDEFPESECWKEFDVKPTLLRKGIEEI